jgi:tetratricopeptide (TPR) repeat protein
MLLWVARRYDEAIREGQRALELDPSFVNAYWWMGLAAAHKRDFPKAVANLSQGLAMSGSTVLRGALGHAYALAGERTKALGLLSEIDKLSKERYVSPVDRAVIHAGLGDADSTFHWMEAAYRARATRVHELPRPYFDRFRSDPRYADLMRRIGLPA